MAIKSKLGVMKDDNYADSLFYELFQVSPSMLAIVDTQLCFQYVNPAFCQYFSKSVDDIIGGSVQNIYGAEQYEKISLYFETALSGQELTNEHILDYPKIGLRNTRCTLFPRYDQNKEIIGLYIIAVDISEQLLLREFVQQHKSFEHFISSLSSKFLNLELEQIDEAIINALQEIGEIMEADRCFIFLLDKKMQHNILAQMWFRDGIDSVQPMEGTIIQDIFPWLGKMMLAQKDIVINTLDELPENAQSEKEYCFSASVKSFLMIPIIYRGQWLGQIGLDMIRTQKNWQPDDILRFRMLSEVIANAMVRKAKDTKIKELQIKLNAENDYLREEIKLNHNHGNIIGNSLVMKKVLSQLELVAPTDANVLILGETGTGKELLAHSIHRLSQRNNKTMVSVNCAALPSSLIESELFGREKGAYTGALTKQIGRFELAHESTLFLDEIGELALDMQSKLLRVLQYGEFERIGSPRTIKVDVRLIVATNRNLEKMVKDGTFREDLYYRLNVFPLHVPPLRERLSDVPLLVWALVRELEKELGRKIEKISKRSMQALCQCQWPGNVRELRNIIERTMILVQGPVLEFTPEIYRGAGSNTRLNKLKTLEDVEFDHISSVLKQTGGRIRGENCAAEILGLKPTTLESRMKRLGIKRQS